jgi:F0F1-type ATP synthase epsilon subunit
MAGKQFTLNVINQDGIIFYGSVDVLFVPSARDVIAIMAYHTPMIMRLGTGQITVKQDHKTNVLTNVRSGIVYVGENEVSVLVNS